MALLTPAHAQEFTYGGLVGGQVRTTLVYGSNSSWCLVDNGNTQFQIDQSNANAVISFAEVIYFDGSTYYSLDGQARMTFTSAAGGTMHFKRTIPSPGPVYNATFTDFTQTLGVFNPPTDQLIVRIQLLPSGLDDAERPTNADQSEHGPIFVAGNDLRRRRADHFRAPDSQADFHGDRRGFAAMHRFAGHLSPAKLNISRGVAVDDGSALICSPINGRVL
jgi:hypothetical protein